MKKQTKRLALRRLTVTKLESASAAFGSIYKSYAVNCSSSCNTCEEVMACNVTVGAGCHRSGDCYG